MFSSRRAFLKNSLGLASAGLIAPSWLLHPSAAFAEPDNLSLAVPGDIINPDPNLLLYESFEQINQTGKVLLPWALQIPSISKLIDNEDGGKALLLQGAGTLEATFPAMLPGRSYRFYCKVKNPMPPMNFVFFDMEGNEISRDAVAAPDQFNASGWGNKSTFIDVPQMAVAAHLKMTLRAGQSLFLDEIELRQIATVESFDWRYWNAWSITLPAQTTVLRRTFEMTAAPAFGIARIVGVPDNAASLFLNNHPVGTVAASATSDGIYHSLKPYLQKGKNTLELRLESTFTKAADVGIDAVIGDAAGRAQVLQSDDLLWQLQLRDGNWRQPDFAPSWYKKDQFAKAQWFSPREIPENLIAPFKARLSQVEIPTRGTIGTDVKIAFQLEALEAIYAGNNRLKLEWLNQRKQVAWTQYHYPESSFQYAKPGEKFSFALSASTTCLPAAGEYTLRLAFPLLDFGNGNELGNITISGAQNQQIANAEIDRNGTIPHFKINESTFAPAMYLHHDFYPSSEPHFIEDYIHDFAQNGINLCTVDLRLGEGRSKDSASKADVIWLGAGKYNWEIVDAIMARPLSANPGAFIMPRISFDEPRWWADAHPEEIVVWDDGKKGIGVSYASKSWREDTARAISDILTYIRSQPYGSRIFGVFLTGGYDGQWMQYFDTSRIPYGFTDYCAAMQIAFRDWLRKGYDNDETKLKTAWGNPTVTFETAPIPTRVERLGTSYYLDPIKDRNVIDFGYCWRDETYDCLVAFCQAVKNASDNKWLAGSYYVPSEDCSYFCAQTQLARNPAIYQQKVFDFCATPAGYNSRPLDKNGDPGNFLSPGLHGKLLYTEEDIRTFQSTQVYNPLWGGKTAFESVAMIRRNLSQALCKNASWYMYDMYGGWYHSPLLMREIKRFHDIDKARMKLKPQTSLPTQIARVTTESTFFHKRMNTQIDLRQVHALPLQMQTELQRSKFNIDLCMLEDVRNSLFSGYNIYLIDDLFYLNKTQRQQIDSLKRDGNILVFTHAIGYMDDTTISPQNISGITGMAIKESDPKSDLSPMSYQFQDSLSGVYQNLQNLRINTTPAKKFYIDDSDAIPLARFVDNKQTAVAVKNFDDWTSVYLASAYFPHQLVNSLAATAKVLSFGQIENATIVAGSSFLSVYAQEDNVNGKVTLPDACVAYDIFEGKQIDTPIINIQLQQGQTKLYFVGETTNVKQFTGVLYQL